MMNIKVCGMKYPENMLEIATLKPTYMGFIFWEPSPRFFSDAIPEKLPEDIKTTGVFVNETLEAILNKVKKYNLQAVQLHGKETADFCCKLKKAASAKLNRNLEIIKVFSIKDTFNFEQLKPYEPCCDFYLFDTKGKLPGGNGYTFNWKLLYNYPSQKPYFLSGGIGITELPNLKKFLKEPLAKLCYAIDLNSRFETEPGLKDLKLLKTFTDDIL